MQNGRGSDPAAVCLSDGLLSCAARPQPCYCYCYCYCAAAQATSFEARHRR